MFPVDDSSRIGAAHQAARQAARIRTLETTIEALIDVTAGAMSNAELGDLLAVSVAIADAQKTLKGDAR